MQLQTTLGESAEKILMLSHVTRLIYFHCTNGFPGHSLDYYDSWLGPQRIFQETPVAVFQLPCGTFPHGIALKIPLRSPGWIFESAKLPRKSVRRFGTRRRAYPADLFGILLWPGNGPTLLRRSRLQKAILRLSDSGDRSINFTGVSRTLYFLVILAFCTTRFIKVR